MDGLSGEAYGRIEALIVFEELTPGSLVSEKRLMELTGLGRTPVREAIQSLARHRMLTVFPSKGILIPPIMAEDEYALLEVRRALEVTCVRLACSRQLPGHAEQLRALLVRLDEEISSLREYADLVGDIHHVVADAAGNAYLADAIAPLQSLSRRFWHHHVRDVAAEIRTGSHHLRQILESVLAKDADRATQASIALNDYLVDFTRAVVSPDNSAGARVPEASVPGSGG